jgi:hypothetical protein
MIGNFYAQAIAAAQQGDLDRLARRRKLGGVRQQIGKHLQKTVGVDARPALGRAGDEFEAHLMLYGKTLVRLQRLLDQGQQRLRGELEVHPARGNSFNIENIVDQVDQAIAVVGGDTDQRFRRRRQLPADAAFEQTQRTTNRRQRRAQLMADRGHELGLELLHFLAFGNVARQPDETTAVVHDHLGHRQLHRKTTAVGTLAKDFAIDTNDLAHPGLPISTEIAVMGVGVRRGHQHLDIAPEYLRGGVAEQPLGGQIEAFDQPLLVNGDDRIESVVEHGTRTGLRFAQFVGHAVGQFEGARARSGEGLQEGEHQHADQRTASQNHRGGTLDYAPARRWHRCAGATVDRRSRAASFADCKTRWDLLSTTVRRSRGCASATPPAARANETDIVDRQVETLRIVSENAAGQILHAKGRVNDAQEGILSLFRGRYRRRIAINRHDQQKAGLPSGFLNQGYWRRGRRCASRARTLDARLDARFR